MPDRTLGFSAAPGRRMRDRGFVCAVWGATGAVVAAFAWLAGDLVWQGAAGLDWSFFVEAPRRAGRAGGIAPILVSTLLILAVAVGAAAPLGLATAILLSDFAPRGSRFAAWTGLSLDILAGVPSIVFGLFGNAFFSLYLGMGFSILAGGLTLACMILPLLIRVAEQGLRAVPDEWRAGAAALGFSRGATLFRIVIPVAMPALTAGLVLGIGRATAETAALIFTSGYVDRMPESLFDSGRALSVHIYDLAMNVAGGNRNAYASALVLILLLIAINAVALGLAGRMFRERILYR